MYYTIGQRKGLGISDSTPYYVVSLNEAKNEVVLGKADELFCSEVMVADVNWISIKPPQHPFSARVKLRYSHQETLSTINPINDHQVRIALKQPQKSVAPGQAAVFYEGDDIIGRDWRVLGCNFQLSNPSACSAAASPAPAGCCSLLYDRFYLPNDGNGYSCGNRNGG